MIDYVGFVWLGGRDSNPDNVVQSHVSYRWTTSQCQSGLSDGARTSDYSQSKTGPATHGRHRDVLTSGRSLDQRVRSLSSFIMLSSLLRATICSLDSPLIVDSPGCCCCCCLRR